MNVFGRVVAGSLTLLLILQSASGGDHHTLRFLHRNTRTPQKVLSMAISPDGKEVSLCVEPGVVHFIRTADGEKIAEIQAQPFVMNYSRDGSRILMVGRSETLSVETRLRGRTPISLDDIPGQMGLRINRRNRKLLIESVHEGGPAAATGKFVVGDEIIAAGDRQPLTEAVAWLRGSEHPIQPFHWQIEFPEVFTVDAKGKPTGGFDAIVGNPPFLGGTMISTANGEAFKDWLYAAFSASGNRMDFVAYFFRRAFTLLRHDGTCGLVGTNTIAQGDTRKGGLRVICESGGTIYNASRRVKWPGEAAVVVSVVHVVRGERLRNTFLDGNEVPLITAFLFSSGGHADPEALIANKGRSFEGFKPAGQGFLFDDTDPEGSDMSEYRRLVERIENRTCIHPFLGGEDVNESPTHAPKRYAIDFGDMELEEATQWPEPLEIVRRKVKPYRDSANRDAHRKRWWQYGENRPGLRAALRDCKKMFVVSRHTQYLALAQSESHVLPSEGIVVFAFETFAAFDVLQSRALECWVRFFGSSLEDRLRYTPSDCFATFPFPSGVLKHAAGDSPTTDNPQLTALETAGREYYEFRAALMVRHNEGLTKTYNRFHDPHETSPDILQLRELHAAMDRAVLDAYGWHDLAQSATCEFLLNYEDDEDDEDGSAGASPSRRQKKKPWRYRWPDPFRDEVLARLLELNKQRAEEERLLGATAEGTVKKKAQRSRKEKPNLKGLF